MTRIAALVLVPLVLVPVTWLGAHAVRADSPVPDVLPQDLPVSGTCAPLDGTNVTRVLVGPTGLYRVDGAAQVLDQPGLEALLSQRSGGTMGKPGRHSVWATVSATQVFKPLWALRGACSKAGIFRIGLEVKSEQGGTGLGFPLFIPAAPLPTDPNTPGPRGRKAEVMLDRWEGLPSHPRRLFDVAKRASEQSGPVVAEVSLDVNLSVQHIVTCVDLLYRGGCTGVYLRFRDPRTGRASVSNRFDPRRGTDEAKDTAVPTNLLASIRRGNEQFDLSHTEPPVDVPPLAPRAQPWGDDGANAPGALSMYLEDLPATGATKPAKADTAEPLPVYAGKREGVPTTVVVAADQAVAGWASTLGTVLTQILHRKFDPKTAPQRFVSRTRMAERLGALVEPAAQMFVKPQRVTPSTLALDVYLVRGINFVGKVEVTLHVAGNALSFISADWIDRVDVPAGFTLPPAAADPFAAGVPGHIRVWLEAAFATVYRQGSAGLPLAPANEVLAQLPTVAHRSVTERLNARAPRLELLSKWLAAIEYDRLVIAPRAGTAAVHAEGRVAGILTYELESEEQDLKLISLRGREAPK